MTCREFIEFLMAYLDMEVNPEQRAEFDRHLAVCPSCRAYLESYKRTVALGASAFNDEDADLPPSVPQDLINAIMAARQKA